jgi:hypothetical protein
VLAGLSSNYFSEVCAVPSSRRAEEFYSIYCLLKSASRISIRGLLIRNLLLRYVNCLAQRVWCVQFYILSLIIDSVPLSQHLEPRTGQPSSSPPSQSPPTPLRRHMLTSLLSPLRGPAGRGRRWGRGLLSDVTPVEAAAAGEALAALAPAAAAGGKGRGGRGRGGAGKGSKG